MSEHVAAISDDSFESDVLNSETPVLVDFWAEWCGPCKAFAPTIDDVASEFDGKVKFVKLDIDENPGAPAKYGVRGIPTLILFKGGNVEATQVGSMTKQQLSDFLDTNI